MRRLRRLIQKRSLRWSEGVCVLEGPDLIDAALESDVEFEAIFVDADASESAKVATLIGHAARRGVRVFTLQHSVLESVADVKTPQPVVASVRFRVAGVQDIVKPGLVLILHDVRDPGNVGTIIRSADAAGVSGVVLTGNSVDPFNPKTLRATAGSVFHLPVVVASLEMTLSHFAIAGVRIYGTVVRGGTPHRSVDLSRPCAVVIGNEADGLDAAVIAQCDEVISITMDGRNESLNAGVAASLIAFESLWQRQGMGYDTPAPSL